MWKTNNIIMPLGMTFLLLVTYLAYLQGLPGIFILDDQLNLSPLGKYQNFSYWDRFWLFILEGNSGPTGRPISLASFFFNNNNWPSLPKNFTFTNIIIHLVNGILVFWLTLKLSTYLAFQYYQKLLFAFIATSLWILHPLHTSTVLYIIQRMTELSSLFILTGLIFYLYGRDLLETNKIIAFFILFLGVGLSLLFSILSKENGILLVAFILVIEFFILQPLKQKTPQYFYYWFIPAVVIPFIAILIYLGVLTNPDSFENRNFTLVERLLTEPRVLFDYMQHIFIPTRTDSGIFHDDYRISKDLFNPITTLPSIIGIVLLFIAMWVLRKKAPLIAFAIAWFFAGHIIESTTLSLELYFEHRNYLPLLGFLICIAYYLSQLFIRKPKETIIGVSLILGIFILLLLQNTKQWADPIKFVVKAYHAHPQSDRAQEAYLLAMQRLGVSADKLNKIKQLSMQEKTPYFVFQNLDQACQSKRLTPSMINTALQVLIEKPIHGAASATLISFVENCIKKPPYVTATHNIEIFLTKILNLEKVQKGNAHFHHNVYMLLSEISKKNGDFDKTMTYLRQAYAIYPEYELLKRRAGYFTSTGFHKKALDILNNTSQLETTLRKKLAMKIKQKELEKIKQDIRKKLLTKN